MREGEPDEYENGHGAEEAEVAAIAPAEGIPQVAGHAEDEADVHGDPGEQAEDGDLRGRGVEMVLEHEGGGNIEEDVRRNGEDDQRERAEVEKEPLIF